MTLLGLPFFDFFITLFEPFSLCDELSLGILCPGPVRAFPSKSFELPGTLAGREGEGIEGGQLATAWEQLGTA